MAPSHSINFNGVGDCMVLAWLVNEGNRDSVLLQLYFCDFILSFILSRLQNSRVFSSKLVSRRGFSRDRANDRSGARVRTSVLQPN